jgi:hypothetical protein
VLKKVCGGIRVETKGLFGDLEIEDIIADRADLLALPNSKGLIYDDFHHFAYYFFGVK